MQTKHLLFSLALISSSLFGAKLGNSVINPSLVIYDSNSALVHEERTLSLKAKDRSFIYDKLAKSIDVHSLHVKLDSSIELLSQRYTDNRLTPKKLFDANLGKNIIVHNHNSNYTTAVLLSYDESEAIVQQEEKLSVVKKTDIIFHTNQQKFATRPSFIFAIKNEKNIDSFVGFDYLIKDINFQTNYALDLNKHNAKLTGWVSIHNRSGKDFDATKVTLVAGAINRAENTNLMYKSMRAASSQIRQASFEGYHLYEIPFNVTLKDNDITQIKYLTKHNLQVQKKFLAYLSNPLYQRGENKVTVEQKLFLEGFNKPLIKGVISSYAKKGQQQILLGQTYIPYTPKNRPLELKIGKDFDTKVIQRVLQRNDSKKWFDVEMEYKVINSSDETKTVQLYIPFNTDINSKIKTTQKYTMSKGNLVTFRRVVPANSSQSFSVNFKSRR